MKYLRIQINVALFIILNITCNISIFAQTSDKNYVKQIIPRVETNDANSLDNSEKTQTISYSDGLGRTVQKILIQATDDWNGFDLVQPVVYDANGQQSKSFLPYVSTATEGSYQDNFVSDQLVFYNNAKKVAISGKPFSETVFENSPLNRATEQSFPGDDWSLGNNHTSKTEFLLNSIGELTTGKEILQWTLTVDASGRPKGATSQPYTAGKLYKTVFTDENGKVTIIYKDMEGKTICKRTDAYTDANDKTYDFTNGGSGNTGGTVKSYLSYYVYDKMGRPVYYIPIGAYVKMRNNNSFSFVDDEINDINFKEFIYAAYYDNKGRKSETYEPKAGRTHYIYNLNNELILMQDAKMQVTDDWLFIKYDRLGRQIKTGICNDQRDFGLIQDNADHEALLFESRIQTGDGYTNDAMPQTVTTVFTINYFDDYNFSFDAVLNSRTFQDFGTSVKTDYVSSLPTASKVNILGTSNYLYTLIYYNLKGQPIQLHQQGYGNVDNWDINNIEYNFSGQPINTERIHIAFNNDPISIKTKCTYDHAGRLIDLNKQINQETQIHMVNNEYNSIGQLVRKNLHADPNFPLGYMQRLDYRYNIRGWLTNINNAALANDGDVTNEDDNDVFGEELFYNNDDIAPHYFGSEYMYNGNVSYSKWRTQPYNTTQTSFDNRPTHSYAYRYDDFNRLTGAYYTHNSKNDPDNYDQEINTFTETESYDVQGNIQSLQRYARSATGATLLDDLTYMYTNEGNQLAKVSDAVAVSNGLSFINNAFNDGTNTTNDYTYDENGSLLTDKNKALTSIIYNYLKQPQQISTDVASVTYIYDATGRKLRTIDKGVEYTYISGIEYKGNELQLITTEEGRMRPKHSNALNTDNYVYDYLIKDHLGNIRVTLTNEQFDDKYWATMEDVNDPQERQLFDNVPETREDKPATMPADASYTPDDKVSKLNPALGKPIGHAKVLQVQTGDKINLDTKYYFTSDAFVPNNPQTVQTIITQLAGVFFPGYAAGTLVPEQLQLAEQTFTQNTSLTTFLNDQLNTQNPNDGKPLAFLTWLLFDKKFNLVPEASGVLKAENSDQLGDLAVTNIEAPVDGYLYVYVSNESVNKDVSFDNLKIGHVPGCTLEENHYYPYGLLIAQLSTLTGVSPLNKYKYQGKELQNALDINMIDFGARQYDAVLGRWNVQDPMLQYASPYLAMGDNPVSVIDPTGMYGYYNSYPQHRSTSDNTGFIIPGEGGDAFWGINNTDVFVMYPIL